MASAAAPEPVQPPVGLARRGLAGFLISGLLFSLLGVLLPVWREHLKQDFLRVGNYFLSMNAGVVLSLAAGWLYRRRPPGIGMAFACALASATLVYFALLPPGMPAWTRIAGMFFIGYAVGVLNTGLFQAISPLYLQDRGATINLGGTIFGAGCILVALLVAGTFYAYSATTILLIIAALPALYAVLYARTRFARASVPNEPTMKQAMADFKNPTAVLFALLLFFQFGNEWALAGWLPLFLINRLGISPASSLMMLAAYWLALLAGRFVVFSVLPSVGRGRLLSGTVLGAMLGCVFLLAAKNPFGAVIGLLLVGGGFGSVYPLVVERIGSRFRYHPGFFNGIFSFAMTGGLLAPASLGLFADLWGVGVVALLPLLGTVAVFVLLILIWAEARFRESRGQ